MLVFLELQLLFTVKRRTKLGSLENPIDQGRSLGRKKLERKIGPISQVLVWPVQIQGFLIFELETHLSSLRKKLIRFLRNGMNLSSQYPLPYVLLNPLRSSVGTGILLEYALLLVVLSYDPSLTTSWDSS